MLILLLLMLAGDDETIVVKLQTCCRCSPPRMHFRTSTAHSLARSSGSANLDTCHQSCVSCGSDPRRSEPVETTAKMDHQPTDYTTQSRPFLQNVVHTSQTR
ncbi:hypothetical protein Tsp_11072 [Trichinella spiralis]|uniref:hypothetical protein n=1 Tax=Trichinella spiralis TaxID=6334 RepID=UPI0001EFB9AE|nr:hypothetical protein Tsp_11072 [Trichinella spiralis]